MNNKNLDARSFINGNKMAIVVTQSRFDSETATLTIPNYKYLESSVIGDAKVISGANSHEVKIGKNGLAVLVFEK
jgi:hypothetical protein